ncbi:MAG TPA: hypothetical protein DCW42_06170 [Bacteroidetes bacterium]|nr:hypothetical protein [Bacteroidota bacterium]
MTWQADYLQLIKEKIDNSKANLTLPQPKDKLKREFELLESIYKKTYKKALDGDEIALILFIHLVEQYLEKAQNLYKSSSNYLTIFDQVIKDIDIIKSVYII